MAELVDLDAVEGRYLVELGLLKIAEEERQAAERCARLAEMAERPTIGYYKRRAS